jgi:putative phosphoesterase
LIRIGLLSDTHGWLDPRLLEYFAACDEVWHAGDLGPGVAEQLAGRNTFRAVHGNIDDTRVRAAFPADLVFTVEGLRVVMTHIGGYPGAYSPHGRRLIDAHRPGLFVCGHSHICKVIPDPANGLLHVNPGAAGRHGFHKVRTAVRFSIEMGKPADMQVIELGPRSAPLA